jgi:hypothetical protein
VDGNYLFYINTISREGDLGLVKYWVEEGNEKSSYLKNIISMLEVYL